VSDANIRIPAEARDRLAEGMSLCAYLARLAEPLLTPTERAERAEKARAVLHEERLRPQPERTGRARRGTEPTPGRGGHVSNPVQILLDDTAMVAADRANILASWLIHRSHAEPGCFLYDTACALAEADRARPGTPGHIAALPGIIVIDLPAALAVARETTWAGAHPVRGPAQPGPPRRGRDRHHRTPGVEGTPSPHSRPQPLTRRRLVAHVASPEGRRSVNERTDPLTDRVTLEIMDWWDCRSAGFGSGESDARTLAERLVTEMPELVVLKEEQQQRGAS